MENIDFHKDLLDNLIDGLYLVDRDGRITYWNKAAENLSGYAADEVLGKKCSDNILMHVDEQGNSLCGDHCPLQKAIADGLSQTAEINLLHKEGYRLPVAIRIAPIRDSSGEIIGAAEVFFDNSAKVAATQKIKELEDLIYTDQLTGVANRKYMETFINSRLEEMRRHNGTFGVLFLDIDHFKSINDTHGHDIGDDVLKMVAQTLVKNLRAFDAVGRWGGEEFLCVITHANEDNLSKIAEKLRNLVEHSSLIVNNLPVSVTISIGALVARQNDTLESIVRRADKLMYQSKTCGRNGVTVDLDKFDHDPSKFLMDAPVPHGYSRHN
jgi:diguanylate cyclase (GGDEF)-like protein/PAS domain S-box-containing protein